MINFCEDCGAKNTLRQRHLANGKAVFKCAHCGYLNAYAMDSPKTDQLGELNLFIERQLSNRLIMGAFLFHLKENQVLINHMPGGLKKTDLIILGKLLTDSYNCCHEEYADITELTLQVGEKTLTVQTINQDIAVVFVTKKDAVSTKLKQQFSNLVLTL